MTCCRNCKPALNHLLKRPKGGASCRIQRINGYEREGANFNWTLLERLSTTTGAH